MTQIVLTGEQAQIFMAATEPVEIRDETGNLLGIVARGLREDEIALARERLQSDGPWISTRDVLEHLNSLERK
ncbi:MAG: hypothetical protein KY475_21785 [Planctomycetes bacterium]|nr:hypothetical protein [Planctomycetota bacterium]